ncbi:MAG TPA: hypothetical protein VLA12_10610, partial [Planctomycetaceae bacterium]|nr:hypothetical protein [Planctomycetaceae bacterium]
KFTQDSWGNAFHILQTKIEGENYISIRSAGPDARFHTDDDIVGYYPFTPYGYEDAWGLKTMNIDKSVP